MCDSLLTVFSDSLYSVAMDIKTYLSQERGRQAALAKAIGAHAPDVSRWADGKRPIPIEYGAAIESATGGLVTRREMFPNDWARVWPELVDRPPATESQPQ
jgi:DNA-binding transcriptional regulator YdaS (Cro superfamily)